jgi:hypothetical protein
MKEYKFYVIIDNKKDTIINHAKSVYAAIDNVLQMPIVQDFFAVKLPHNDQYVDLMDCNIEEMRNDRANMENVDGFVSFIESMPDESLDQVLEVLSSTIH